jgi:hypothetical protein
VTVRIDSTDVATLSLSACTLKENMVIKRKLLAIGLLAAMGTLVHAEEADQAGMAGKTDPESGKSCVAFFSSESIDLGRVRMHFRNICDSPFQIQIMTEKLRKGTIEAGTTRKPGKGYVTCRADDQCETAKWTYE